MIFNMITSTSNCLLISILHRNLVKQLFKFYLFRRFLAQRL